MHVAAIENKNQWEQFIASRPEANFLQSWQWGVFQESMGKRVWRVGLVAEDRLVAGALVVMEPAKRGKYLSVAGGPLIDWTNRVEVEAMFAELRRLAQTTGGWFIRFRPQVHDNESIRTFLSRQGAKLSPMHMTADITIQLDLTKSEQELLAGMRKSMRYEIRKADNFALRVESSTNPDDVRQFYNNQLILAKKHKFVPFGYNFLFKQFEAFSKDDQVSLFHAYDGKKLLASAFVIFYNREAVYHYGVSTEHNARLPGSPAVLWEAIKEAKRRGCLTFNLWGVAPQGVATHRFSGVSLFKRGFGGEEIAYVPAHDLVVGPLYWLTYWFEVARRRLRRL